MKHSRLVRFDQSEGETVMPRRWIPGVCVPASAGAITIALGVPLTPVEAQGRGGRGAPGTQGGGTAATGIRVDVDLLHVMRGILFPSSNVVFAAQDDMTSWKPAPD